MIYVATDSAGRIYATTTKEYADDSMFPFDFPEGFDFSAQRDFRIVDGEIVHDPEGPSAKERIAELRMKLAQTDSIVIEMAEDLIMGGDPANTGEHSGVIEQRREWRKELAKLEGETDE